MGHGVGGPRRLTVVMPLYNKVEEVPRAIGGVLAQTVRDFEFLVVNDGSTDGSDLAVRRFDDPRVRVIDQPNAGESAARNRGIDEATGTIIAFCDADDEWRPNFLREILSLSVTFPECEVYGTSYVLREPTGTTRTPILRGLPAGHCKGVMPDYFSVAARSDPPLCSSSIAASKVALRSIGGFPVGIAIGADLLTWARLGAQFRIAYSASPQVEVWLRAPFGAPPGGRPTRIPDPGDPVGTALASILSSLPEDRKTDFKRFVGSWHRMRAEMFLRLDKRRETLKEVRRTYHYSPSSPAVWVFLALALTPRVVRRWSLAVLARRLRGRRR